MVLNTFYCFCHLTVDSLRTKTTWLSFLFAQSPCLMVRSDHQLLNEWTSSMFHDSVWLWSQNKTLLLRLELWGVQMLGKLAHMQFADFILPQLVKSTKTCCILILPLPYYSPALTRDWLEKSPASALSYSHQHFCTKKQQEDTLSYNIKVQKDTTRTTSEKFKLSVLI